MGDNQLTDEYLLPYIPKRYRKSFARLTLLSVTVEIHGHIGKLKKQKLKPGRIHLCPICSVRFCYEQNKKNPRIDQGPKEYLGLPIVYRSSAIRFGVWVEPIEHE